MLGGADSLEELEEFLVEVAEKHPVEEAVVYGVYRGEHGCRRRGSLSAEVWKGGTRNLDSTT